MKCSNCGKEIHNGYPNCTNCGFSINNLSNNNYGQNIVDTNLYSEVNNSLQEPNNMISNNYKMPFQINNVVQPQVYNGQINAIPENNNVQQSNYQQNNPYPLYQNIVNNTNSEKIKEQQQYNNFNQKNFTNNENNIYQSSNKRDYVFIFIVIGLVIIIVILVILILNKNDVFNNSENIPQIILM